ncbi:twin-arginine translocase TatA/TatE family subunit [uncultured Amnibacterium sp.]|uniref:twin-arginine translocase TatA/TatE family subunit n=1 Tax=uncultured Amnibacterium sp. TaxID=1631851 RepID=UPI0035C94509
MLAGLTGVHLLVIVAVLVLLFGATKLPQLAKGLGQSVKVLRSELGPDADPKPSAADRTPAGAEAEVVATEAPVATAVR